jgi:CHAD domain-containing protein
VRRSIAGAPPAPSLENGGREPLGGDPRDLLWRPAAESVRRILLMTLDRIEEAAGRLQHGADAEALHDFRVGLRRLRSLLRAFRALVAADLPGRAESRLRSIARATNSGRDAEVQAALLREWLRSPAKNTAPAAARSAAERMAAKLERRRDALAAATIADARRDFSALGDMLRRRLATYRVTVELAGSRGPARPSGSPGESLAGELARQVTAQWAGLRQGVAALAGIDPPEPLHRVRIETKRLRYLLEPWRDEEPEVGALLQTLRSWQDLLGEFQDAVVFERRVASRYVAAVRRRARALVAEARRGSAGAAARARRKVPVSPRGFLPLLDLARDRQRRCWSGLSKSLAEVPALEGRIERLCSKWSAVETSMGSPSRSQED